MKSRPGLSVYAVMAVVVLGACSGSDSSDETEPVTTSTPSSEVVTETTDQRVDVVEAPTPETSAPVAETAPPATEPPAPPAPLFGNWDELIGLETADGEFEGRPVLSWSPVDGADHYGVYVYAPGGQIYWAWRGRDTSTTLGGDIGDAEGPAAGEGMTWAVIAWDADLLPLTVSLVEPLPV